MQITIIGWYGTETIGDRAILAGILTSLTLSFQDIEIHLGSLYPFFTERTLNEDYSLYKEFCERDIKINLFNSKIQKELDNAINKSDFIIMGGGPLMHIHPLFMIEYAFKKAKKLGKKTIIMGCGVGPLHKKIHQHSLSVIFKYSDLIILRDQHSKAYAERLVKGIKTKIHTSLDPAVICINEYQKRNRIDDEKEKYVAINLRSFPAEYSKNRISENINNNLRQFVKEAAEKYSEFQIELIPMHYFHIGGDDRIFLNDIHLDLNLSNVVVQNKPLTLIETMKKFENAQLNVGMRFHSVVLQTLLVGNNIVLDYTEPGKGKISGFISDIGGDEFYKTKYLNLQDQHSIDVSILENIGNNKFQVDKALLLKKLEIYNRLSTYLP